MLKSHAAEDFDSLAKRRRQVVEAAVAKLVLEDRNAQARREQFFRHLVNQVMEAIDAEE